MLCFLHFLIVLDSCHFKFVNLKFDPQCKGNSWLKWSFLIYLCYILLPSFAGIFFRKTHARVSRVGWFSCFTPLVDAQHEAPLKGGPVSSGGHFQASLENDLHCPQKPVLAIVASNFIVVPFSFNCQENYEGPLYAFFSKISPLLHPYPAGFQIWQTEIRGWQKGRKSGRFKQRNNLQLQVIENAIMLLPIFERKRIISLRVQRLIVLQNVLLLVIFSSISGGRALNSLWWTCWPTICSK